MAPLVENKITMQRIHPYILPALLFTIFAVAYYPAFALFAAKWSASEDYAHAFLIVPIIGYIVWLKRRHLIDKPGAPVVGSILVVLAIMFYLVSLKLQVPTLIFLATGATLISALIFIAGFTILKEMAVPILLYFMIIPIPNQLLSMVTASLQLKISEISEVLLRLFSIPLYREGNVLNIPNMAFQVVDACSGVRSLISMTTLSVIISHFTLTRLWSASLLFLFSIPVAILINIIRVVTLVLVYHFFHLDLSAGAAHTTTGLVLFIFGLALLFTFQRVLELWEIRRKHA